MRELTSPTWIKVKACLFLFLGLLVYALLLAGQPTLEFAFLLTVAIWSFCRFYYFIFYVVEHCVDRDYRFSGLLSFLRYLLSKRR